MDRKLTLDIDNLTVNSFETTPVEEVRGTVQGQEAYFAPSKYSCNLVSYCCPTRNTCTTELC